ncbi:hypothetical protein D3Z52_10085 [Clostridiaceae bacterium]|nr:hypothetical protein [Clostridiaceae bacterium]
MHCHKKVEKTVKKPRIQTMLNHAAGKPCLHCRKKVGKTVKKPRIQTMLNHAAGSPACIAVKSGKDG